MKAGERQVAPTIDEIRADHVNRYKWAISQLPKGSVIDAACGIGYGSFLLAESGRYVRGIEIDQEAVDYGNKYYVSDRVYRQCLDLYDADLSGDPVVMFECIEHVVDPLPILKKCTGLLLASVPNEEVFPYRNHKFHYRHYAKNEFEELLNQAGFHVEQWFGQEGAISEVEENMNGRTLIAVANKI
jgi:SAM-dependent methyltransferase